MVDYIPRLLPTRLAALPTFFHDGRKVFHIAVEAMSRVQDAQFFLFASSYEIESHTIDILKGVIPIPIHPIGDSNGWWREREEMKSLQPVLDL